MTCWEGKMLDHWKKEEQCSKINWVSDQLGFVHRVNTQDFCQQKTWKKPTAGMHYLKRIHDWYHWYD